MLKRTTSKAHDDSTSSDDSETHLDPQCRSESWPSSSDDRISHEDDSLSAIQKQMSERCKRNGEARYAVKYLMLADATRSERVQARVDLAIEVNFLHVLSHPHIIKMRGLFKSETPFHSDYFFVMDRLFGTLEDKTKEWIAAKRECKSHRAAWALNLCGVRSTTNEGINNLLIERLLVAHDIASVLGYMHSHGVIYR